MTGVGILIPSVDRLDAIAELSAFSRAEARDLVGALVRDTIRAVDRSGGTAMLVVDGENRSVEPTAVLASESMQDELPILDRQAQGARTIAETIGAVRAVENGTGVMVVRPISPMFQRRHVDAGAMRLRSHAVVLGPSTDCHWYACGATEDAAFASDGLDEHLTGLALSAGGDTNIGLLPHLPGMTSPADVPGTIAVLEAASLTDLDVAPHTRRLLDQLGIETDRSAPGELARRE